jgi:GTP pyrophosphokinase
MMRQYELVDRVRKYNPNTDEDLLNRAYVYAMRAHGAQTRASGDPYFSHPLEVAAILTEMKLDDATIVAAVLHDTIEDTGATRAEIDRLFGPEIGALVDGLTKLKKLDLVSKKAAQAENFRKLLLAISEDVRVLLVKLADRLHNMRTLHFVSPDKRARIAEETLDIYAPLAGRMGMQVLRDELENLAFKNLNPEAFAMVSTRLEDLRDTNRELIRTIEGELAAELHRRGIKADVRGRQKQPYSVWAKMERKSVAFEQLSDIFGFRVVVDQVEDCYRVIGVVHTKWPMVPGRFKDYISTPKQNDYRSVHTTVVGPGRQRVELQVRTHEMHDIARNGIAAHALYKDDLHKDGRAGAGPLLSQESSAYQWLKRTIDILADGDSPEEFLEHTRLELFHDQVFCFTPKGRLIALPRGATPIDFAYAVHTSVGNSAVGVKINGRLAPLLAPLANGDEVEIVRAESGTPPAAWESIAVTGKARAAIRKASRDAVRAQYAGLGRQIVLRAFERAGKTFAEDKLKQALPRLARAAIDDVLAAVGRGEMFSGDVVKAVYPDFKEERKATQPNRDDPGWFTLQKAAGVQFKAPGGGSAHALPIRGLRGDLPVTFAPDGGAVPGDRIVGILTPGVGVTIYPIQASALAQFDDRPELWLDVRWDMEGAAELFPAKVVVAAFNEPGSLGAVASLIGETGANIDDVKFNKISPDFRELYLELQVFDLKHLNDVISRLRALPIVHKVERIIG